MAKLGEIEIRAKLNWIEVLIAGFKLIWLGTKECIRRAVKFEKYTKNMIFIIDVNLRRERKMVNYGSKTGQGKGKGMPGGGRRNQNPTPCGKGSKGTGKGTNR